MAVVVFLTIATTMMAADYFPSVQGGGVFVSHDGGPTLSCCSDLIDNCTLLLAASVVMLQPVHKITMRSTLKR